MTSTQIEQLQREIDRYLAAVEAFRQEGREPQWAAESPSGDPREIPYAA